LAAVDDPFRSPPVSAWPDADDHGVTGLIVGYRIEARYEQSPTAQHFPDGACVVVTVRRSTD